MSTLSHIIAIGATAAATYLITSCAMEPRYIHEQVLADQRKVLVLQNRIDQHKPFVYNPNGYFENIDIYQARERKEITDKLESAN